MNNLIRLAAATAYLEMGSNVAVDDEENEDFEDEGGEEPEAVVAKPAKKKVKKGGKKVAKKEVKKASAKSDKSDKNIVRLKDLAKQAKLTEAVARKKLRDAEVPRGEGRWSWDLGSKSLKSARKALGLGAG